MPTQVSGSLRRAVDRSGGYNPLMGSFLASVSDTDLSTLFLVVALLCICGAAYCAWLRNIPATVLLVFVAIVAVVIGT